MTGRFFNVVGRYKLLLLLSGSLFFLIEYCLLTCFRKTYGSPGKADSSFTL